MYVRWGTGPNPIACEYSVVPALLVEKTILFPLNGLCALVVNQLTRYECISGPSVFFCWYICPWVNTAVFFFLMILFITVLSVYCSLDFSLAVSGGSYSPVVVHRLLTAVASFLAEHMGLVVTLNGSSCLASCGIFPDQRSNPCALHCQANSLPLSHQGSPGRQSWFTVVL